LTSLIDVGTSLVVLNATTQAVFGSNAWNFVTDSWFGRPKSSATDSSWEISLYEIVTTLTGMDTSTHGFGSSGAGLKLGESVQKNLRANGPTALATVIVAPMAAKIFKRLARGPIRDANRLMKWSGIQQATGVKI
jgi:hypothetical protein